jgi:hypothetical protein
MHESIKWSGKPISKPGIYRGIPIEKYHRHDLCDGPSMSSSGLRTIFSRSPAHFYCAWSGNPERVEEPETNHLILGRAGHHLLLGEESFSISFVVRPDQWDSWRTKDAKLWREAAEKDGKTCLIPQQLTLIRGMAKALEKHPIIQAGALDGMIECSMIWQDSETGIWLKARPDAIPNAAGDYCDLKSTNSVDDFALRASIASYGYYAQGALVLEGAFRLFAQKKTTFSLIFVESEPPHCVRVCTMPDEDLVRGQRQNRLALLTFKSCLEKGEWPGPGSADAELLGLSQSSAEWIDKKLAAKEQEILT